MSDQLTEYINQINTEKITKIQPDNIKAGVTILGVEGEVIELHGETKTITPTTSSQTITPSQNKNGITEITVEPILIENTIVKSSDMQYSVFPSQNKFISEVVVQPINLQNKTVTITENGTTMVNSSSNYDGLNEVEVTVNVSSLTFTNGDYLFYRNSRLNQIEDILNKCNFNGTLNNMFQECTNLTTVPLFDTSNVTDMSNMFQSCSSLSNDSLNNILAMCTNATKMTSNKTLRYIGLTSAQATTCQSLSNWSAFTSAGWTTGY